MKPTMFSFAGCEILKHMYDATASISLEIVLFVIAMLAYAALFKIRLQEPGRKSTTSSTKLCCSVEQDAACPNVECCEDSEKLDELHEEHGHQQSHELEPVAICPSEAPVSVEARSNAIHLDGGFGVSSLVAASLPPLSAVVTRAASVPKLYANDIRLTGRLPEVKAARKTLKKHGLVNACNDSRFPLNGQWETDVGMPVTIEGKVVRWSEKRASRLKFAGSDRRACSLGIYGETTVGRLMSPRIPAATTSLKWDNGDTWHKFDSCRISNAIVYSQSMTKPSRDKTQDAAIREQAGARLELVSKDGLPLLPHCMDHILEFLGSEMHYVDVRFDCNDGPAWVSDEPSSDFLRSISRRHPRVGFHHCWAEAVTSQCGQRMIIQGNEVTEAEFSQSYSGGKAGCLASKRSA